MFGLSSEGRELDQGIVPLPIKLLALAMFGALAIYLFRYLSPERVAKFAVSNDVAYGCYTAVGQSRISLDADGMRIPDHNIGPVPYQVGIGGSGRRSYIELSRPLIIAEKNRKLDFATSGDSPIWRFEVLTKVGGSYSPKVNREPISSFNIITPDITVVKFRRGPLSEC